jgi:hypothetical protein
MFDDEASAVRLAELLEKGETTLWTNFARYSLDDGWSPLKREEPRSVASAVPQRCNRRLRWLINGLKDQGLAQAESCRTERCACADLPVRPFQIALARPVLEE